MMMSSPFSSTTLLLLCMLFCTSTARLEQRILGVWTVTEFNVFTANPGPNGVSSITFQFPNSTTSTTTCTRKQGSGKPVIDPKNFYTCEDPNISFKYANKWLAMSSVAIGKDGSMTTSFGNGTLDMQCYAGTQPDTKLAGRSCEMPTSQFSIPVQLTTTVSTGSSMSTIIRNRFANALSQMSAQKASVFTKGMSKRDDCFAVGQLCSMADEAHPMAHLDDRQVGNMLVSNFVGHNFDVPMSSYPSSLALDLAIPAFGINATCSAIRPAGQGSAASSGLIPCANTAGSTLGASVNINWTAPLSIAAQLTLPNLIGGGNTTISAEASMNGFCLRIFQNGNNDLTAGNKCLTDGDINPLGITGIVDQLIPGPPSNASSAPTATNSTVPFASMTPPAASSSSPANMTSFTGNAVGRLPGSSHLAMKVWIAYLVLIMMGRVTG